MEGELGAIYKTLCCANLEGPGSYRGSHQERRLDNASSYVARKLIETDLSPERGAKQLGIGLMRAASGWGTIRRRSEWRTTNVVSTGYERHAVATDIVPGIRRRMR